MTPNTHHTRKSNHEYPRAPHDQTNDTIGPSHGQAPPQCGAIHVFFFVNGRPFLHTKSRIIYFGSVEACNRREKSETISGLKPVKTKYKDRGFTISDYHGDNEFDHLHYFLAPTHIQKCATNNHIGDIKRSIRKIKE